MELREYSRQQGIQIEAWAPLAQGKLPDNEVLKEIAAHHNKSVAQIIIRWDIQHEIVTIPKSTKEHRINENADVYDFELSAQELARIDALNQNQRIGADPDNFNF